jgi:hypothetical protein
VHGTLNGIHLDQITSITTEPAGNSTLTTIRGIEACSEDAELPFNNILDRLTGSDPSVMDYVLEVPGIELKRDSFQTVGSQNRFLLELSLVEFPNRLDLRACARSF